MKKLLVVLVLVLMGTVSFAQWTNGTGNNIYKTVNAGFVGIGITNPTTNLEINGGTVGAILQAGSSYTGTGVPAYNIGNFQAKNLTTGDLLYIGLRNRAGFSDMVQSVYDAGANAWREFIYFNFGTRKYEMRVGVLDAEFKNGGNLLFNNTGNVGIGTTSPLTKLSVNGAATFNGKIKCTEIEVLLAAWPDNVFKAGYNLLPLSEVEEFINSNKHLPDVPSEETVLANGANLGEMNATLLKKIEELTLYMIQLKKDNDALATRISKLEK